MICLINQTEIDSAKKHKQSNHTLDVVGIPKTDTAVLVEKPPVDTVDREWHMLSKISMGPAHKSKIRSVVSTK